jgi:hypothetical protein
MVENSKQFPENALWQSVETELSQAKIARDNGFEGKARVCARRAAGKAFVAAGLSKTPTLAGIRETVNTMNLPIDISEICNHLMKIVDENYTLENNIDLLSDVSRLISFLRNDMDNEKKGKHSLWKM